uniref:Uncharacterized protein n=1 Tax=Ascaris lumbricoides TaxID=6252 RepID=A0A0M3IKD6_ASCLU
MILNEEIKLLFRQQRNVYSRQSERSLTQFERMESAMKKVSITEGTPPELVYMNKILIAPVVDAQKVRECWTTVVPASDSPDEEQIEASNRIDEKIRSCDELTTNESLTKKS